MGRAGVNQTQLAKRINMSGSALSQRLTCDLPFTTDHLFAIAETLDVDPLSLMRRPMTEGATA